MNQLKRELYRKIMNLEKDPAGSGELKDWERHQREKESRIFQLMGKEAAERMRDGSTVPTPDDRLNEHLHRGL